VQPRDDIPLPPEPPPEDAPPDPLDDGPRRRPTASGSPSITLPATSTAPAPRVVRLADDEPSADDPDLEGSHLVGASVVEQLLGGRVIEEHRD
jgi:DNA polymerase-3 subunit gamma/tau